MFPFSRIRTGVRGLRCATKLVWNGRKARIQGARRCAGRRGAPRLRHKPFVGVQDGGIAARNWTPKATLVAQAGIPAFGCGALRLPLADWAGCWKGMAGTGEVSRVGPPPAKNLVTYAGANDAGAAWPGRPVFTGGVPEGGLIVFGLHGVTYRRSSTRKGETTTSYTQCEKFPWSVTSISLIK